MDDMLPGDCSRKPDSRLSPKIPTSFSAVLYHGNHGHPTIHERFGFVHAGIRAHNGEKTLIRNEIS